MGMEAEVVTVLAQLGAAGLIGLMWLTERRLAGERERQLTQQHERIMSDKRELAVLLAALESNTRAIVSLETGQRRLASAIENRFTGDRSVQNSADRA